jgi:hypothetical protein
MGSATFGIWHPVSHSGGAAILVEGKGGSPPPLSMGHLSQDGVGYVRPPCFGFTLGSDPNLKEPYPQPYPSFSHGGCASQAYILRDFQGEGGSNQSEYHHFDLGRFMQGMDEENLERFVAASIVVCKYSLWVLI